MQDERDVIQRRGRISEHLRDRFRNHADHLAILRISDRFRVADHTDNREPWSRVTESPPFHALANGILVRLKTPRNATAYDAHERRVRAIAFQKLSSPQKRLVDAFEISGAGGARV